MTAFLKNSHVTVPFRALENTDAGAPGKATLAIISCAKLKSMDLMSLSDPFVVLEKKSGGAWTECARTEVQGWG